MEYGRREDLKLFTTPRQYGKTKRTELLMEILLQYKNGEEEIIVEVPKMFFTMQDMSLLVTEFNEIISNDNKVLDFGFKQKDDTIKMKLIIEERMVAV
jgi:hypothetical protein